MFFFFFFSFFLKLKTQKKKMSYNQYEITPVKADINKMRTDVNALEAADDDTRLDALEAADTAIETRVSVLENSFFQSVPTSYGTQGSANVDYPWFDAGSDTLSVAAGVYRISGCYDISPSVVASESTILRLKLVTTGTVTRMRCVVVADVNRTTNVTRLTAVNTNENMYLVARNNSEDNLRGIVEGYIVFATAGTIKPVFSWSANCTPTDLGTEVNVDPGTFFELRPVFDSLTGWS